MSIFVVCPINRITGGIELVHQMCYVINHYTDEKAYIWYVDMDHDITLENLVIDYPAPDEYISYETECVKDFFDIDKENNVVVFPEGLTMWLPLIDNAIKVLWWMSVDNYTGCTQESDIGYIADNISIHLYQSYYAKEYVERKIKGARGMFLSDYINEAYGENIEGERQNIALFNPKKGLERLKPVIFTCDYVKWIPIYKMTRDEVISTMHKSKVYIDFGHHPGKDRIPREAAASGCCVITNMMGSAANDYDVPIPGKYKFSNVEEQTDEIIELIKDICDNFESHRKDFDAYRQVIKGEKEKFISDIIDFVEMVR